ncbi:glycosyltransferase family 22 protein, partial [Macrolepiota fuliginosa MF-IS2]
MASGIQTLRFRGPENKEPAKPQPEPRHSGILQDQLRRAQRRPWTPKFSVAIRIMLLVRAFGAMYSNIDDCDEVFNFWEPLHFLDRGYGFQTWEVTPQHAIRSWAYILLHLFPATLVHFMLGPGKRPAFFAVRYLLAIVSTVAECAFYRTVVSKINERVGRYLYFMMLFNAGMWNASTAFLPSSFAMYTTAFAFSYALEPATLSNKRRTLVATVFFALGAIVGWPFALAISIPFVFEELFVYGGDRVSPQVKNSWLVQRWTRFLTVVLAAALIFIPVIGIDSLAYGRLTAVPWNIVKYNIFGGSERGPDLYGTSPWYYYIHNLLLNFNYLLPLALISLPALAVTYVVDHKRLGFVTPSNDQSSPFTLLALRLAPFYLWLTILTAQAHKEERFMFPAYPLLCFNAAVTLYLVRGWMEVAFVKVTKSPYQASRTLLFRNFTLSLVVGTSFLSLCRIRAMWVYYHAPLSVMSNFESVELPQLLNNTGLLPVFPPGTPEEDIPVIDLAPLKHFDLVLCFGKEWHRFSGHYLVPTGIRVEFIKSDFRGQLPRHFQQTLAGTDTSSNSLWFRPQTRYVPTDVNDLNKEDSSRYVLPETCDYLIDLDFPLHPAESPLEPRYAAETKVWERAICKPFLDARHSSLLTRTLWLPGEAWQAQNEFGDYCLLKNKVLLKSKQEKVRRLVRE